MAQLNANNLRNVALLSHSGAGKTTLSEALLFAAKAIPRLGRVEEGNTASDWEPESVKRKISLNLSVLPLLWGEHKINLLDSPGYADFLGEMKAGLRVAEAGVVVVCCASGVEVGTELAWRLLQEAHLPRLVFLSKLDRENADFLRILEELRSKLGAKAIPLQLPIGSQAAFQGVVDLISGKAYIGAEGKEGEVPQAVQEAVASYREKLIEAAVESDDELISRYLDGGEITAEEILRGIARGTQGGQMVPVLVGSALKGIGLRFLAEAIIRYFPSPAQAPAKATGPSGEEVLEVSSAGPLSALVFKTTADPYIGRLSYFRVYSGAIFSNSQVWNGAKGQMERVGQLFVMRGKNQEPVAEVGAGDIGAVPKLSVTATGDTLTSRERPLTLPGIVFPSPTLRLAVVPRTKADLDKMGIVLPRLLEEDPTLRLEKEQDTGEILLVGLGETHIEVSVERLQRKFGVGIMVRIPKVPYKETITVPTRAEYRHKKQTGGHGQFAHVFLALEPLPRGTGLQFEEKLVGQSMSRSYVPSVEKGVLEAAQEGGLGGFPVVDVKATLYDGKEHPVDSSDICFKIAGANAFKTGAAQAQPTLLEPIMRLRVSVPEALTGDVIGDLNTKRARVLGMVPEAGTNHIEALVPLAEVQRYVITIQSLTQGRGRFTMEFSHYEAVPPHVTQRIIAEAKAEKAGEKP